MRTIKTLGVLLIRAEYPEFSHEVTLFLLCLQREWVLLYSSYICVSILFTNASTHVQGLISTLLCTCIDVKVLFQSTLRNEWCLGKCVNYSMLSLLVQCLCQRSLSALYCFFVLSSVIGGNKDIIITKFCKSRSK